jgi:hypothetical protein
MSEDNGRGPVSSDDTPDTEPAAAPAEVAAPATGAGSGDVVTDEPAAARRPSPSARARRIGGRPLPGPRPAADESTLGMAIPTVKPDRADKDKALARPSPSTGPGRPRAGRPQAPEVEALHRQVERLRWIPAGGAAVALLAALVLGVWQSHGVWWGKFSSSRNETRTQVLAAAKTCTVAVLSYDYRKLDASEQAGTDCGTGEFQTQYKQSFQTVRQIAPQKKTVQTFQVARGGVQAVSADGKQWVIMLYGQISYTDSSTTTPRLDISSPVATMSQVGGRWVVTNLQIGG